MIDSLRIKNFRCFRDLSITGMKRFNLIVGPSGSGKTALLESMFLIGAGSPEVYFRLRKWRGLSELRLTGARSGFESVFRELFFAFDKTPGAALEFTDSHSGRRQVWVNYKGDAEMTLPLRGGPEGNAFFVEPMVFKYKTGTKVVETSVQLRDGAIKLNGMAQVYPIWLITPSTTDPLSQYFSELSVRGETGPLIAAFRQLFPQVRDISLESIAGELAICCSIEPFKEKLPIGMLSSGMSKYLSIMIAIASNPGGAVLIDEIENGFYFDSMTSMLESVCSFCEDLKVQLFATSHSDELITKMAQVMTGEREKSFSLMRAERGPNGESSITIVQGPMAVAPIAQGIEIR